MEPRLGLLEEVQSEADGGEAEEEELWVRGCTVFLMNLGKIMDMLWTVFCLGFSYSVRKRSFAAAVTVGIVAMVCA